MNGRFTMAVVAATLHLALVACGAAGVRLEFGPGHGALLQWYGALTASQADFAFFAPRVPAFPSATFVVTGRDGARITDTLERGRNQESDLRLAASAFRFEEAGDSLAPVWVAGMFRRHPDAARIAMRVDIFDPPTMAAWRDGDRGRRETIFERTFDRPDGQ